MIEVTASRDYERLDVFMAEMLHFSRAQVQRLIRSKNITGNTDLKQSMKVSRGDTFHIQIPHSSNLKYVKGEDIDFEVVYEDNYLIIINKPAGLIVHPAESVKDGTLVNGLVKRYPEIRLIPNRNRPGIVHRLDSGTSGLMVVARRQNASIELQKMFSERKVSKRYLALMHGCPKKHAGILSGPIERDPDNYARMAILENGKPSFTGYKVLWSMNKFSLVECNLLTGRTHQIRVHFSALGCPLVGDTMYGANDEFTGRIYLHSWKLEFTHPVTHEEMKFRQNVPEDFTNFIASLKADK